MFIWGYDLSSKTQVVFLLFPPSRSLVFFLSVVPTRWDIGQLVAPPPSKKEAFKAKHLNAPSLEWNPPCLMLSQDLSLALALLKMTHEYLHVRISLFD